MTAAIIGVVANYTERVLDRYEQAELNYDVERQDLGIAGGKQDQYATTFGGFNLIEFYSDSVIAHTVELDPGIINDLESHLLLCYTGQVRANLGLVCKQVRFYYEGRKATLRGMFRLRELAYEMAEALVEGRLTDFGEMLHEAYVNKKAMNPEVRRGRSPTRSTGEGRPVDRRHWRQAARGRRGWLSAPLL